MSIEIKPTDLMIGNWFYMNGFPMYVDSIFRDTVYLEFEGNEGDVWEEDIISLTPIPLTEEILLKVGGKRFDEDKIILMLNDPYTHLILMKASMYWFTQIKQTGGFASDGVNIVSLNFIGYLHQLQNLFKALTGNDLNIAL